VIGKFHLRGLGSAGDILYGSVIDTGLGTRVDCRDWGSYLLNTGCWKLSHSDWQSLGASYEASSLYPQVPPAAPPTAPQTVQQMTEVGAWTPDQAIQGMSQQQKAASTRFFESLPTPPTGDGGNGNGRPAPSDLCSKIFGAGVAGTLGRVLCPVVMVVGGVAVVALVALIFSTRR
jgi:hypothetical protein